MGTAIHALALVYAAALAACGSGNAEHAPRAASPDAPEESARRSPSTDEELEEFIGTGARMLAVSRGDINADGRLDVVLAVDQSPKDTDRPRPLLLLLRDNSGRLRLAARNDRMIPCAKCGGILGEPSIAVDASTGAFVLRAEGGSGSLWSNEYSFRHEGDGQWVLAAFTRTVSSRTSGETETTELAGDDTGMIDFTGFDPDAMDWESRHKE